MGVFHDPGVEGLEGGGSAARLGAPGGRAFDAPDMSVAYAAGGEEAQGTEGAVSEEIVVYGDGPSESFLASFLVALLAPPVGEPRGGPEIPRPGPPTGGDVPEDDPLSCLLETHGSKEEMEQCCTAVQEHLNCEAYTVTTDADGRHWCNLSGCPKGAGPTRPPHEGPEPVPVPVPGGRVPWVDKDCKPCSREVTQRVEQVCLEKGQVLSYCDGFWNESTQQCDGRPVCISRLESLPPGWSPFP